ncbi:MAG: tRNA (adenosine(37)-N6)-threonylcarbamoyltransferase complex transferase subunit TsaD [Pseudomonadota bacterium]
MADSQDIVVMGVETSCDDTAVAIVRRDADARYHVLANVVWTDHGDHALFGGIVPEIAARSHVERLDWVMEKALREAGIAPGALGGIAATAGPGLVGGVLVGLTAAKAFAMTHETPLIPVNHLEGHALSVRLTDEAPFPFLLLLISGGHSQLILAEGLGRYRRLGVTIDDAAGEAFDKTAKLLGLSQPGGPAIEAAAKTGDATRFRFPAPLARREGCDFSFSGMKTAVRETAIAAAPLSAEDTADIAASFQAAVARHLAAQSRKAMQSLSLAEDQRRFVLAGGVAANTAIKEAVENLCKEEGWRLTVPPPKFCTDNGAMIAVAGAERLAAGLAPQMDEALALAPRARWPLAPPLEGGAIGGGRKGPKA